jgi:hypothetical protein
MERTMKNLRPIFLAFIIGTFAAVSAGSFDAARAATPEDLNRDADHALHKRF